MQVGDQTQRFLETPPSGDVVTDYDRKHCSTYLKLLDAQAGGAEWSLMAEVIFGMNPRLNPLTAERIVKLHVERAQWMSKHGFKQLVKPDAFKG
jgi:hypothetical protein